jgi:hypothetical protein
MAFDFARILRVAETLVNVGQAARRFRDSGARESLEGDRDPTEPAPIDPSQNLAAGSRVLGQIEARLAGVLVSALKEAFDLDRAHLEMEREQIEHERRRADELMRLELLRQAGERELSGIRSGIVVVLAVWVTSVLFLTLRGAGFGAAGLVLVGVGWALLLAALGASFAAHRHVSGLLSGGGSDGPDALRLPRRPFAPAIPWLIVGGLACTAASLLVGLVGR